MVMQQAFCTCRCDKATKTKTGQALTPLGILVDNNVFSHSDQRFAAYFDFRQSN